jgi:hypothetical protein
MSIDKKYFAHDGDKFMFWVNPSGYISNVKFSVIYGNLQDEERLPLFKEFKELPVLEWDSFV